MKTKTFFSASLISIAFCTTMLTSNLGVQAQSINPNSGNNSSDRGWTTWNRWDSIRNTNLNYGLTNEDAEALMNLEKFCIGEVETANSQKRMSESYWYRASEKLLLTSSGEIQIGCWNNQRFKSIVTIAANRQPIYSQPAISNPVQGLLPPSLCRQVQAPVQGGLKIRSQPGLNSSVVGGVSNRERITLTAIPPVVASVDGRSWIQIQSPVPGWIANGSPGDKGNLILCR